MPRTQKENGSWEVEGRKNGEPELPRMWGVPAFFVSFFE